jgi:hypothetical protein
MMILTSKFYHKTKEKAQLTDGVCEGKHDANIFFFYILTATLGCARAAGWLCVQPNQFNWLRLSAVHRQSGQFPPNLS